MYAATGDPNLKRGAQVLNGGRAPLAARWRRSCPADNYNHNETSLTCAASKNEKQKFNNTPTLRPIKTPPITYAN